MKFFNRFRKSALPGIGLRKYVLYAIGEIILVVVGILIALGINQASERNAKKKEMHRIATLVSAQMAEDASNIDTVLKEMDFMERMIDTVLYQTPMNQPLPADCSSCYNILMGSNMPNTSIRVPNLIRRNPLVESDVERQLHKIELLYNDELQKEKIYDQVTYDQLTENINYWKNNFDWFAGFFSVGDCNADCQDYFQNSSDYRNRVAYFEFTIIIAYYVELDTFKKTIEKERAILEELL